MHDSLCATLIPGQHFQIKLTKPDISKILGFISTCQSCYINSFSFKGTTMRPVTFPVIICCAKLSGISELLSNTDRLFQIRQQFIKRVPTENILFPTTYSTKSEWC